MATFQTSRPAPFGAISAHRFVSGVENYVRSVSEWNTQRKTRNELSKLTARELSDIGLSYGDLDNIKAVMYRSK
jgi:uncharacterized protein YjiS (DUF1127 family)